ncbi:hypothetical protein JCM8547_004475 [Rhodosporidiobolus lusitaniae]
MSPPLTVPQLRAALAKLNLDSRGNKGTLKKRLAKASKFTPPSSSSSSPPPAAAEEERRRPPGQEYDSYLVFDVEATCERIDGAYGRLAFQYPNEIIEWPVILLQWRRRTVVEGEEAGDEWELVKVDEFHSFVRPMWKPALSNFCTELTGIRQSDIASAPTFPVLCRLFQRDFMAKHHLFTPQNRTIWVTDGPWDLRDFVSKTCYLSRTPRPDWLAGEIIDLRIAVSNFFSVLKEEKKLQRREGSRSPSPPSPLPAASAALPQPASANSSSDPPPLAVKDPLPTPLASPSALPSSSPSSSSLALSSTPTYLPSSRLTAPSTFSLPSVLSALTLPPFQGRLHSGLSDARNASRVLIDLATRGVDLKGNRKVPDGGKGGRERRWGWMVKGGERTGECKWEQHKAYEEGRVTRGEGKPWVQRKEEG